MELLNNRGEKKEGAGGWWGDRASTKRDLVSDILVSFMAMFDNTTYEGIFVWKAVGTVEHLEWVHWVHLLASPPVFCQTRLHFLNSEEGKHNIHATIKKSICYFQYRSNW